MSPEAIRLHCLRLALEKRAGSSAATAIVEEAKVFASYVQGPDTAETAPVPAVKEKPQDRNRSARLNA